jgi:hypothetical protein
VDVSCRIDGAEGFRRRSDGFKVVSTDMNKNGNDKTEQCLQRTPETLWKSN